MRKESKWIYYNPNPSGQNIGDCVIRAICKATNLDWESTYARICAVGFELHDMPSSNRVWGAYLSKIGFARKTIQSVDFDRYTVKKFCYDNPSGTFVVGLDGHVVCVVDGHYYDTWDSGDNVIIYYWTTTD